MTTSAATPSHTPCAWGLPAPARTATAKAAVSVSPALSTAIRPNDARSSSPNYFGLTSDSTAGMFTASCVRHVQSNLSPPNSNVHSRSVSIDQNPELEAFRRKSEETRKFCLGGGLSQFAYAKMEVCVDNALAASSTSHIDHRGYQPSSSNTTSRPLAVPDKPRSPKRMLTLDPDNVGRPPRRSTAAYADCPGGDKPPRFADSRPGTESITAPPSPVMVTAQEVAALLNSPTEEVLVLDIRKPTEFKRCRIRGALNLCISTIFLKRSSFNTTCLAETFGDDSQRQKFDTWEKCSYIIVYDADSSQPKDATACINMLNKFPSSWDGSRFILRGGVNEFQSMFPTLVTSDAASTSSKATNTRPTLRLHAISRTAPGVGSCPIPLTRNAVNPFFENIRQNMDLIGGVGDVDIKRPSRMNSRTEMMLPTWLRAAVNSKEGPASLSDKFLWIEKREQRRMQEALSGGVEYGESRPGAEASIRIAGIEKGGKNRYNNIWPFEHTRVKLQDVASDGCDYVNANHIEPPWSKKRYIATQGPIPVTFADFWSVVWHEDVRVIVMLTAEVEGCQLKAHNYWSGHDFGPYRLNLHSEKHAPLESGAGRRRSTEVSTASPRPSAAQSYSHDYFPSTGTQSQSGSEQPYVIIRKFTLSNTRLPKSEMREITQLQYPNWPDFGAPADPAHLLALVEQCDAVVRQTQGGSADEPDRACNHPVLVHCSAGCGRTGTFCTVDSVIDSLKRQRRPGPQRQASPMHIDQASRATEKTGNDELDSAWLDHDGLDLIERTVETFRNQRLSMVQSLRQFALCYESVLEWFVAQQSQD